MTIQFITYDPNYLDATARLYEQTHTVPTYEDRTTFDVSREVIMNYWLRNNFIGVLAVDESAGEVVGFAWGYGTPVENKRITDTIIKRVGKEWVENTFMVEGFALHFEHQTPELAQTLHDTLIAHVQDDAYDRLRIRLHVPRLDTLTDTLQNRGWETLEGLTHPKMNHVLWMGKILNEPQA